MFKVVQVLKLKKVTWRIPLLTVTNKTEVMPFNPEPVEIKLKMDLSGLREVFRPRPIYVKTGLFCKKEVERTPEEKFLLSLIPPKTNGFLIKNETFFVVSVKN